MLGVVVARQPEETISTTSKGIIKKDMRKIAVMLAPWLASCGNLTDPPEVVRCEQHILSQLANPESYSKGEHSSLRLREFWQVGIEYSYTNEGGSRVASAWQICDYPIVDGKPDTSRFLKLEGSEE